MLSINACNHYSFLSQLINLKQKFCLSKENQETLILKWVALWSFLWPALVLAFQCFTLVISYGDKHLAIVGSVDFMNVANVTMLENKWSITFSTSRINTHATFLTFVCCRLKIPPKINLINIGF